MGLCNGCLSLMQPGSPHGALLPASITTQGCCADSYHLQESRADAHARAGPGFRGRLKHGEIRKTALPLVQVVCMGLQASARMLHGASGHRHQVGCSPVGCSHSHRCKPAGLRSSIGARLLQQKHHNSQTHLQPACSAACMSKACATCKVLSSSPKVRVCSDACLPVEASLKKPSTEQALTRSLCGHCRRLSLPQTKTTRLRSLLHWRPLDISATLQTFQEAHHWVMPKMALT